MMKKLPIILILMAILVPSMIGYVHKSRKVQTGYDETAVSSEQF